MYNRSIKNIILLNLGAFLLVFALETVSNLFFRDNFDNNYSFLAHGLNFTMMIMGFIWVNHFVFIPFFLDKKKYFAYGLLLIASLLIFSYLRTGTWAGTSKTFFFLLYTTGAGMAVFLLRRNVLIRKENDDKEKLQKEMELNYLKEQVNPHFLFNSLNSIYALSRQASPETPELVMQLSELMRYQLESSKKDTVLLKEELEFIENYLLLEEKRLSNRCNIEFLIRGELKELKIAPMLLIPFVENAIKHGAQSTNQQSTIDISVAIENSSLHFCAVNSKPKVTPVTKREGLGLENVKRRLNLLYPNAHVLDIANLEDEYKVNLTISLVDNK